MMAIQSDTFSSIPGGTKRQIIAAAALLVIVVSSLALIRTWRGPRAVVDTGPYEVVGRYLGEAVAQVLGESARVLVLEPNMTGNPASAERGEALLAALQEHAIHVVAREKAGGTVVHRHGGRAAADAGGCGAGGGAAWEPGCGDLAGRRAVPCPG